MKKILFLLFAALLLSACSSSSAPTTSAPPPTQPPPPPTDVPPPTATPVVAENIIAFSSNRGETPNVLGLYLLNLDTMEITPVETGFDTVYFPQWSPDGNRIAFVVPEVWNIYTIEPTGETMTQITDFRSNNMGWSPDGTKLVFQSDSQNEPENVPDIYMMDVPETGAGENLTEILDNPPVLEIGPRWSPTDERVFYISAETGNLEIFSINPDGTDKQQLTALGGTIQDFSISPDGTKIAFAIGVKKDVDIYIVDTNLEKAGWEDVTAVIDDEFVEDWPSWSPDGTQLIFFSSRSGNMDLWLINVDGSDLTQITDDIYFDLYPNWKP